MAKTKKKQPAAAVQLRGARPGGYWASALDLRNPPDPHNAASGDAEDAPHGGRPSPTTPHRPAAGGGGGGGGGGAGGGGEAPAVPDWEQALIASGMPADLVGQIADYFKNHASDPDVGTKALALVRGSDWWKQAFAGFWQGVSLGLFSDETGYRAWKQAANDSFKRFYGRDMTSDETVGYLARGATPQRIEQEGSGHAFAEVNKPDIQWATGAFDTALTDAEREAYGQENAGIDSALGQKIKARVDKSLAIASRVFQGQLGSPNLQIGGAGLAAPSLNPQQKPDIGR